MLCCNLLLFSVIMQIVCPNFLSLTYLTYQTKDLWYPGNWNESLVCKDETWIFDSSLYHFIQQEIYLYMQWIHSSNQIGRIKKVRVKCGSTYRRIRFAVVLIEIQKESFHSASSKTYQMNHFSDHCCLELESCGTPEDCVNCEIPKELQIEVENIQYWTNYGDAFRSRALFASR